LCWIALPLLAPIVVLSGSGVGLSTRHAWHNGGIKFLVLAVAIWVASEAVTLGAIRQIVMSQQPHSHWPYGSRIGKVSSCGLLVAYLYGAIYAANGVKGSSSHQWQALIALVFGVSILIPFGTLLVDFIGRNLVGRRRGRALPNNRAIEVLPIEGHLHVIFSDGSRYAITSAPEVISDRHRRSIFEPRIVGAAYDAVRSRVILVDEFGNVMEDALDVARDAARISGSGRA
jgi:hypothetical protein